MKRSLPLLLGLAIGVVAAVLAVRWWNQPSDYGMVGSSLAIRPGQEPEDDDRAFTKARITEVATALRLYRQEHGNKSPQVCKTPFDAGLPRDPVLLHKPGHPWSLPRFDETVFRHERLGSALEFCWLYMEPRYDWRRLLAEKGDKLAIVCEDPGLDLRQEKRLFVGRMDGSVDEVTLGQLNEHELRAN